MEDCIVLSLLTNLILVLFISKLIAPFKKNDLNYIFLFAIAYLISNCLLTYFSKVPIFQFLKFNWLGKIAATIFELILIVVPIFAINQIGFKKWQPIKTYKNLYAFCLFYFLVRIMIYAVNEEANLNIDIETILYQATLPGIQEEILYRGILLILFTKLLINKNFTIKNYTISYASILVTVLFALDHSFFVDINYSIKFNTFTFVRVFIDGFIFVRLVEKTKSIFPSIVYHNLLNLIGNH